MLVLDVWHGDSGLVMSSSATRVSTVCGRFLSVDIGFMSERAKNKLAAGMAIFKFTCSVGGVLFCFLLPYLIWGGNLLKCGDIESNPGSNPPPAKENMRQTRFSSTSSSRRVSFEKPAKPQTSASALAPEPSITDVMASIEALRNDMTAQFTDVKKQISDLREDYAALKNEVRELKEEVEELKTEKQNLQQENNDLCERMTVYETTLDELEGRSKQNNLIFYGVPREDGETNSDCEELLQNLCSEKLDLEEKVEFDRVHRLNSKPDSPVLARCVFYTQKRKILNLKKKLKGTDVFVG